jgi:[ribosomal protein S5]-alanine N-acetyltransferase
MDVPPIRTPRLELRSMSEEFMQAIVDGRVEDARRLLGAALPAHPADEEVTRWLRRRSRQVREKPGVLRWLTRAIVLRGDRIMVGNVGFHGEPGVNGKNLRGALEIGYGILPEFRGEGYATEAVAALLEWAQGEGIRHFIASVSPDNAPSLAIVRKLGFVRTGEQWDDEDGLEHVFELHLLGRGSRQS